MEPGLTAGWLAGRQMQVNFVFLKFIVDQIFKLLLHLTKLQHH